MLLFILIVFVIIFAIALISNSNKEKDENLNSVNTPPPKRKRKPKQKVQTYDKWEKKKRKKAGKTAMDRAEYIHISIDEANELFIYNNSTDEMDLLDIILDAKLAGEDTIKVSRTLYSRLKFKKEVHTHK